jgi:multidrug efflux pump subunit AcrA (membrane-fusion protein)
VWVVGLVALVVGAGVSWGVASRVQSPEQAAARATEPEASWITAPVELRVLASTVVFRGDVAPQVSLAVGVPSSVEGTGVVTRVPPTAGADVPEGSLVVEVSGRPVFVFAGDVPVYRSLKPGMRGGDVAQLQAALVRLGYATDGDGVFGETTKAALSEFYEQAGYEPVPATTDAGALTSAEAALRDADAAVAAAQAALATARANASGAGVVAAQAALAAAQRAVTEATASRDESVATAQASLTAAQNAVDRLASDPGASAADRDAAAAALVAAQNVLAAAKRTGDDAIAAANDQVRVATAQLNEATRTTEVTAARATLTAAEQARDRAAEQFLQAVTASGPTVPLGEVVFVPTMPARVLSGVTALGAPDSGGGGFDGGAGSGGGGSELVRLAAGDLVVGTSVRTSDEGFVRIGMPVELLDETTDTTYPATLTSIADSATVDQTGQLGRAAIITPDTPLPSSLAGVNLRVTITAAASDGEVLVVPLAAVSSTADGTTRVSVLPAGAVDPVDVEVRAGISADGFVAIEPVRPDTIRPGDRVVVGR